jgi:ubiquinone/menaquinone biosynthesis C-methylase UbiE
MNPQPLGKGIDAFNSVASSYEAWFESPLGSFVDAYELQALASLLSNVNADSIIEIGAGTGHIARFLSQYAREVTAIEPSVAMRAEGIQRTSDLLIHWIDARAEHLPYPDAHFDGAVLVTTIEFVDQPAHALHEALRVVRPDGWVIVGFLNALSAWTALYRYNADRGVMPWAAARFYTRTDIEQWVGFPAEQSQTAVYLAPQAVPPFAEADQAGKRAGNAPALEILRWRKRS